MSSKKVDIVKNAIKQYPDFPKKGITISTLSSFFSAPLKGIMFQDIFGVLLDPEANAALNDLALEHVKQHADKIDKIVALDSRGFLFGNSMALAVKKPFVPIR